LIPELRIDENTPSRHSVHLNMDSQGASGLCSQAVVKSVSERQLQKKYFFLNLQVLKKDILGVYHKISSFLAIMYYILFSVVIRA